VSRRLTRLAVVLPVGLAVAVGAFTACGTDAPGPGATSAPLSAQAQQGRYVAQRSGCMNCHSTDGKPNTGPTWKGIWGSQVTLDDGRTTTVDEAYIRRAIQDPAGDQLKGFASTMPKFSLSDTEIAAVTAYIRELGSSTTSVTR
jgi:cytochrome c oxidase subunit 2